MYKDPGATKGVGVTDKDPRQGLWPQYASSLLPSLCIPTALFPILPTAAASLPTSLLHSILRPSSGVRRHRSTFGQHRPPPHSPARRSLEPRSIPHPVVQLSRLMSCSRNQHANLHLRSPPVATDVTVSPALHRTMPTPPALPKAAAAHSNHRSPFVLWRRNDLVVVPPLLHDFFVGRRLSLLFDVSPSRGLHS